MLFELLLMTQLNNNLIAEYNIESNLPHLRNLENTYPSGLEYKDQSHVKAGPPSIDDPILLIVDPIYDRYMNCIPPGYYQLSLDPGREYMYLIQTGKTIATIPVFKIEIDKKKEAEKRKNQPPKTFFKKIKYNIKKKIKDHRHKQNVKKKRIEDEERIYSDATIELAEEGKYFLIKYERDSVKAWGALRYR